MIFFLSGIRILVIINLKLELIVLFRKILIRRELRKIFLFLIGKIVKIKIIR